MKIKNNIYKRKGITFNLRKKVGARIAVKII